MPAAPARPCAALTWRPPLRPAPHRFVHDGLVHRRFPVGPIADLPAMKRIVVAHQLHHSEKYGGVPFGMFLGPQVRRRRGGQVVGMGWRRR